MLFSNISILDENLDHLMGQYVGVKDGLIKYIGDVPPEEDYGEVYDGQGKLLMTGFYNAHSHSAMTLMRGYAENLALSEWLNTRIFPFEAKLDSEAIYNGTMLAIAEMLRFGIVSTTDMYFNGEANARAVLESGVKMNYSSSATCFDGSSLKDLPVYAESLRNIRNFHNAGDGRLKIDLSVHAEYTNTERVVREMADLARETGLNTHIHLSETKAEHEGCKERHGGKTPTEFFYEAGMFDGNTTAAHCVWVEDGDMDIMAEMGVTAASNPVSNLKLASGFCNAPKMLEKGINVALGTDSVASNNNLNILEEVKLFATLFKASTGDPTAITPKQALYAATMAGAIAQGRDEHGGQLAVGNWADLIVFDLRNKPWLQPCHDMVNNIVFSAVGSDVCLTMVNGKVLYRDGIYTTIDIEKVIYNANMSTAKILNQL